MPRRQIAVTLLVGLLIAFSPARGAAPDGASTPPADTAAPGRALFAEHCAACHEGGVQLRKGEMIALPAPLAGSDDRFNANARTVDFTRRCGQHVTFGKGPHFCLGAYLARTEVRITLEEWLRRIPEFSIAPGTTLTYRGGLVGAVNALPLVWPVAAHDVEHPSNAGAE
jgi:hypothetical protein